MILLRAQITLSPEHRRQVLASLRSILEPTRVARGCVECGLFIDVEDSCSAVYLEQWQTQADLDAHMQAVEFRVLLSALEMSADPPRVRFETINQSRGLEMLQGGASDSERQQ